MEKKETNKEVKASLPIIDCLGKGATIDQYIGDTADLSRYLKSRAARHQCFRHYCKEDSLLSILKRKTLILTDGSKWNDLKDRTRFNSDTGDRINFGISFSFSQSENVAMWLLYADHARRGGVLKLSRFDLKKMMNNKPSLVITNRERSIVKEKELNSSDYETTLIDVLYCSKPNSKDLVHVSHLGDKVVTIDNDIIKPLEKATKNEPWRYENECRLIVSVKKDAIPQSFEGKCCVSFPLHSDTIKKFNQKVFKAPNYETGKPLDSYTFSSLHEEIDCNW